MRPLSSPQCILINCCRFCHPAEHSARWNFFKKRSRLFLDQADPNPFHAGHFFLHRSLFYSGHDLGCCHPWSLAVLCTCWRSCQCLHLPSLPEMVTPPLKLFHLFSQICSSRSPWRTVSHGDLDMVDAIHWMGMPSRQVTGITPVSQHTCFPWPCKCSWCPMLSLWFLRYLGLDMFVAWV